MTYNDYSLVHNEKELASKYQGACAEMWIAFFFVFIMFAYFVFFLFDISYHNI